MIKKVAVVTNAEGVDVINTTGIYLQITMDSENVLITEKAEIKAEGIEAPIPMQRPMLSFSGSNLGNVITGSQESDELKALTSAFVNDVFAKYEVYRKAISPILKAQNADNF